MRRVPGLALVLCCLISGSVAFAQESAKSKIVRFDDFDFSQFVTSSGQSPQQITRLDNNGEILLACVKGITRDQLRASGVRFVESQIELLKTWRLLEEEKTVLKTALPILDAQMSERLRGATQAVVPALSRRLEPEIVRLVNTLDALGRKKNAYTILFSYVLDDLVWEQFRSRGLLGRREITAETPLWAGEVWAVYPPRAFAMGTNSVSDKGVSLKVNWTERAIPKMMPFVADIKTFLRMFDDYVEKGRVEDEHARKVFGPFDLFDQTGRFTVPIIKADGSDPLYQLSQAIAGRIAESVPDLLRLSSLSKEFGFRDDKQALVIVYHELMWDFMDHLESAGIVHKPVAFVEPDKSRPADIADLVFIVRKAP
ncbi:MAG: hypothetical protein LAO21_03310 [Acidobacteriia bacterium]|nr:hypothetical protein [Terriglobia bacterium]